MYFESSLNYSYVCESSLNHAEELVLWLDELIFICVTSVAQLISMHLIKIWTSTAVFSTIKHF